MKDFYEKITSISLVVYNVSDILPNPYWRDLEAFTQKSPWLYSYFHTNLSRTLTLLLATYITRQR